VASDEKLLEIWCFADFKPAAGMVSVAEDPQAACRPHLSSSE
jgi:hypothetical protein